MKNRIRKTRQFVQLTIVTVLCVYSARAQHAFTTVEACMRFGVERNLTVKNAELDTRMAANTYLSSLGEFAPAVEAYGNGGKRFGRSVDPKTNLYTSTSFIESNMGLNVSLPLFEGFIRVNRAKFERLNKQISRLSAEVRKNQVVFDVMDAYFNLILEERLLALTREQCELTRKYKRQMEVFLETGIKSKADMQEMEARLRADLYQLTYRENSKELASLRLKQLLDLPESDSLSVRFIPGDYEITETAPVSSDSLYLVSLETLPEARAMELRIQASRKKLALAKGSFVPAFKAEYLLSTGFYNTERRNDNSVIPFGTQLDNNLNHYIGLSVSVPIFSGLRKITALKNERLALRKTENDVLYEKQQLRHDVENACLTLQAAAQEYRKAAEQVKAEEINLRTMHRKWEEGLVSLFELMEVRNRFIAARAEQARTGMQYVIQRKTVRFYETGTFFN